MIKKTITYTDFDGNEQKEDFYFNVSKTELLDMETKYEGGFAHYLEEIQKAEDVKAIMNVMKDIVSMSVGKRSEDGKRFIKNDEIRDDFLFSPAYDELFMDLFQNADTASDFIAGLLPADLAKEVKKEAKKAAKSKE